MTSYRPPRSPWFWPSVALPALLLSLAVSTGCSESNQRGAPSLKHLETGVVEALSKGDLQGAQRFFLDGDRFVAGCPERFRDDRDQGFKRKLANGLRRFAKGFAACRAKLSGSLEVLRRDGGYKKRQVQGCGEGVWEYADLDLSVSSGGRTVLVSVDGIIGIDGRYYVAERVNCR